MKKKYPAEDNQDKYTDKKSIALESKPPSRTKHRFENPIEFQKDLEWLDKETSFADRVFSALFKTRYVKYIFLTAILILFLLRFPGVFFLIFFSFLSNFIRYKRLNRWLLFDVEPTYVFSIILALKFHLIYGLLFILFPVTLPTLKYGINLNLIMRIWNKILVLLGTYYLYQLFPDYLIIYSLALVGITDFFTFIFLLRSNNKSYDTFLNFGTNFLFRAMYFYFLFDVIKII